MGSVKKKSVTYRNLCIFIITVFIFYLFPIKPEKDTVLSLPQRKNASVSLKTGAQKYGEKRENYHKRQKYFITVFIFHHFPIAMSAPCFFARNVVEYKKISFFGRQYVSRKESLWML